MEWKEYTLEEIVEFPPKVTLSKGIEYPFIDMEAVHSHQRYVTQCEHQKYKQSSCSKFQNGDILFARITPCLENGKIAQVKMSSSHQKGFGSTEFFVLRAKPNLLDQNYLYYQCKCDLIWKSAVNSMVGASGRQRADAAFLKKLRIPLPPLSIQRKIAAVLSAYDELIENNRKRIAILEKMAEELYQEWFVRLRFPGHEHTKIIQGIPEGWSVKKLGEVMNITMGQSPPGESYNEIGEGIPFFQGRADFTARFPQKSIFTTAPKKWATKHDILVTVRAPVGDLNIATENCCIGRGLAALTEKNGNYSFTYYFLKGIQEKFKIFENSGTVFGAMTKSNLEEIKCTIPDTNIITIFEKQCRPIDDCIFTIWCQTLLLTHMRDQLLSRLMSGEVEVQDLDIHFPPSMQEQGEHHG